MPYLWHKKTMKSEFLLYAAPLQGYTELAWREAHRRTIGGVDVYGAPFVRWEKDGLRNKDRREMDPAANHVERLVPQVLAAEPEEFRRLVSVLAGWGYREVEVNMGCPFPVLVRKGKGAGLLPCPDRVWALLEAMRDFPDIGFSVKMRLGAERPDEWAALLPLFNGSVVRRLTVHPRVGRQQYRGEVDREQFAAFYERCTKPLVYNGDLRSLAQAQEVLRAYPRLAGLMLGRGLLARPTLALEIRRGKEATEEELIAYTALWHRQWVAACSERIEGGEAQLLQKLRTMWDYLLPDLPKRQRKAILKANRLEAYLAGVREALGQ